MYNVQKTRELTKRSSSISNLAYQMLKLTEETGEAASAALVRIESANISASANDNIEEEVIDVIIVAFDILYSLDMTDQQIDTLMATKLAKWERKLVALGL